MTTHSPPQHVQDILRRAKEEAAFIDTDFAEDVADAAKVRHKYLKNPLRINVPILGAILSGKIGLLFISMTWKPHRAHADEKEYKKSGLHVQLGNIPLRDPEGNKVGDEEFFNVGQILDAGEPDIDYIWLVDWIRQIQGFLNWWARWVNAPEIHRLDLWGSVYWQAKDGEDSIFLPLVTHPHRVADLIIDLSDRVDAGDVAFEKLVKRADDRSK
jgi:hypothetical protein